MVVGIGNCLVHEVKLVIRHLKFMLIMNEAISYNREKEFVVHCHIQYIKMCNITELNNESVPIP